MQYYVVYSLLSYYLGLGITHRRPQKKAICVINRILRRNSSTRFGFFYIYFILFYFYLWLSWNESSPRAKSTSDTQPLNVSAFHALMEFSVYKIVVTGRGAR